MLKYTLQVDGMQCGMCETHVNDIVRQSFQVKKVSSSRTKGQVVIIAQNPIDGQSLKDAIGKAGYPVLSVVSEPYEKKGLFSSWRK